MAGIIHKVRLSYPEDEPIQSGPSRGLWARSVRGSAGELGADPCAPWRGPEPVRLFA